MKLLTGRLAMSLLLPALSVAALAATGPRRAAEGGAPPDPELVRLTRLWEDGRFGDALAGLLQFRRRGADARYRNETVDYLIGTSACRVPGSERQGMEVLKGVLANYRLDASGSGTVRAEMESRCPPSAGVLVPVGLAAVRARPAVTERGAAVVTIRGKSAFDPGTTPDTGRVTTESIALDDDPKRAALGPSRDDLDARLFPPERAAQAVRAVALLAGPRYTVVNEGAFVLAARDRSERDLRTVGRALGSYLDFYARNFGMRRPAYLITVYLAAEQREMIDLSRRIHGLEISSASLGYSVHDDLSMVAWSPAPLTGTLMHELFHLAVREDFGDVPAWLDEGIAALYEVSGFDDRGQVRGLRNWRQPILANRFGSRMSLAELIQADWATFDSLEGTQTQQAVNHATARYFALFLQDTGRLPAVYRAFRARDITAADDASDPAAILRRSTGQSAGELDQAFAAWFLALP